MPKVKLLYDVEQLSVDGLKGTGIVRVCDVLLHKFLTSDDIDLYPVITTKRGNFKTYLKAKGLEKLADKTVYLPTLKATTKNQNFYQRGRTRLFTALLGWKYASVLRQYDAYFSPFSPISPVIYNSPLKTFLMVYDLIPIIYPDGCEPKFIRKFTDWILRSRPDAYFCDSVSTENDLRRFCKRPNQKIYQVPLGADSKFHPVREKAEINKIKEKYGIATPKYFLAVSEITARKNLVHLLQAFAEFLDKSGADEVSLVLVGPVRKGYEDVEKQAAGLARYKDKIIQTGFADDADLAPLYSGAEAFIYPSLYEGFGLPVLEAMQCGTPVICADNTSLPEVGGEAVMYISGHDVTETAQKLQELYQNKKSAAELKEKGLARAATFSWQQTADIIIQAVKENIGRK